MHRTLGMGVLFAILACAPGCVGPGFAKCSAEGGRPWLDLQSEHFTLVTNLSREDAYTMARSLEQTRTAMLSAGWPGLQVHPRTAPVTVYVFGTQTEFSQLFPESVGGFYTRIGDTPSIVIPGPTALRLFGSWENAVSAKVKHELAHYLSSYILLREPRWLGEGLAQFMETLRLSKDGRTVDVGLPHEEAVSWMLSVRPSKGYSVPSSWSVTDVLTWEKPNQETPASQLHGLYQGSWLLVYWLYQTRPEDFTRYQLLLAEGKDPERAFLDVFPDLSDPRKLERMLFRYLQDGSYKGFRRTLPSVSYNIAEHTLTDSEAHALRALLAEVAGDRFFEGSERQARQALGRAELAEARRLDPMNLLATELRLREVPAEQRLPLARAVVVAHPYEGHAWLLLAEALADGGVHPREEEEAAYKKSLELSPFEVRALQGLARLYLTQERFEEAFTLAKRAVELAPWNPHTLRTYAVAAAKHGDCPEAILAERRARALLTETPDTTLRRGNHEQLESICAGGRGTRRTGEDAAEGPTSTEGGLAKESIKKVISRHSQSIRYCYERLLVKAPSREGRLTVRFVIGPEGAVTAVDITRDDIADPHMARCVRDVVERMQFPKPIGGGDVVVTYPWELRLQPQP